MNRIGIEPLIRPGGLGGPGSTGVARKTAGPEFKSVLMDSIDQVNRLRNESDTAIEKLATGQTENVSEVFTAVRKADMAYSMLMEIKNKMLDAYTELRQMRL